MISKQETWEKLGVQCYSVSSSTSRLLCSRGDTKLLLDGATGAEVAVLPIPWGAESHRTVFSPRGTYILTPGHEGEYEVRDGLSGALIQTIVSPARVRSMAVSSDETMVAFASSKGSFYGNLSDPRVRESVRVVRLSTLPSGTKLAELQVRTISQIDTLEFVGNGMLAAGTYDDLTIFDTGEHTTAKRLAAPSQMSFGNMSISPDGATMLVTNLLAGPAITKLWDIELNSRRQELPDGKHHFLPFGNTVVSRRTGGAIAFLDGTTGAVQKELLLSTPSSVRDVACSLDMGVVAAIANDAAWIWDHGSDAVSLQDAPRQIEQVMVSGDGRTVVVTGMDVALLVKQLSEQMGRMQK